MAVSQCVETIDAELLRECVNQGGRVALARVQRLEPFNQGTRGASVEVHLEIEKEIQGSLPRHIQFSTWGGPDLMKPGHRLIIAVEPPQAGMEEVSLMGSVDVQEGKEVEAVQAHQQILATEGRSP
jgi:hypothetical protein